MQQRFLSRKFIMALSALVVTLLIIFKPAKAEKIESQGKDITALVVTLLSAAGYIGVEGKLDHSALPDPPSSTPDVTTAPATTPVAVAPSAGGGA